MLVAPLVLDEVDEVADEDANVVDEVDGSVDVLDRFDCVDGDACVVVELEFVCELLLLLALDAVELPLC